MRSEDIMTFSCFKRFLKKNYVLSGSPFQEMWGIVCHIKFIYEEGVQNFLHILHITADSLIFVEAVEQ